MKRTWVFASLLVLCGLPMTAAGAETVTQLDEEPETYDREVVILTGELVGDFGRRGQLVWTQINDDGYVASPVREGGSLIGTNTGLAVAIHAADFEAMFGEGAGAPGGYRTRGPIVSVQGVFHYHDEERSGESWLEATQVTLVEVSRPMSEPQRLPLGLAGAILGGAGLILHFRARRSD